MQFDDILSKLGEFGPYQKRLYFLLCIPAISVGSFMMMLVIVMASPLHRCKIPGYDNDSYEIQNDFHDSIVNLSIPLSSEELFKYDKCHMYVCGEPGVYDCLNKTYVQCTEWVYDTATFKESFTSKINLVCDDSLKRSHAQMIFYLGVLFGDLGFGMLADTIGRKPSLYVTIIALIASAFGVAWAPGFISFVILEFIVGAANHGAFMICCVLGLEIVGPSKRVWAGVVIHGFFALGLIYVAGFGYFLRTWHYVQIAVAAPCLIYLVYWWLIPESPRWLISKGRHNAAEVIINKVAKKNNVNLSGKDLRIHDIEVKGTKGRIWHLFSHRVLLWRTLIVYVNWAVVSMMYYGVTMHTGNMGGNFYLNFFLLAVVEFPAYGLSIYFLDKMGRKKLHCACMLLGGAACICTIFPVVFGGDELEPLILTLAIIGKMGAAAAFGVIYVFSAELFPTIVRNAGMGSSSCIARVGGMLAPYVASSGDNVGGKFGEALPLVIFGAASVAAGLLCLLLPETLNQKLPESVEDGINFGRSKSKTKFRKETKL